MKHPQHELKVYEAVKSRELEIDSEGRIWRIAKRTGSRWTGRTRVTPCKRVRAETSSGDDYLQVRMMRDRTRVAAAAHRLVWIHYHGPIPDGITINHKNGDRTDNRAENLELATYSQQRRHAIQELGAKHHDVRGSLHPKAQTTETDVMEMRRRRTTGERVKDIAKAFGMKPKAVSAILTRRTWKHVP